MEYKKGRGAQINTRNKFLREENTRGTCGIRRRLDGIQCADPIHRTGSEIHRKQSGQSRCGHVVQHESLCGLRTRMYLLLCPEHA